MNNLNDNTAEFLKSLRIAKGLTQMDLAEHLNVSNKTISKWETGVAIPEVTTLVVLADFYKVTVDDILRGSKRISKNPEKEAKITNYIVSRGKNKYNSYLILSLGIWLLSNVLIIVLGEITINSALGMGIGVIVLIIGMIVQGININHLRLQITGIDLKEKNKLLNFVYHTSYTFLFLSVATIFFAVIYNVGAHAKLNLNFVFYSLIYAYALTAVRAIILYYFIRLFKIPFLNQLKISGFVLNGILLIILIVPFLIVQTADPYELAIKTDNSYVTYSISHKNEQEDRYYQLVYLSLLNNRLNTDDNLRYDENTYEFIFTFDEGYELVMSNETFSFISSLKYVKFDIQEDYAIGYRIDIPRSQMGVMLYSSFTAPLISLFVVGTLVYYFLTNKIISLLHK